MNPPANQNPRPSPTGAILVSYAEMKKLLLRQYGPFRRPAWTRRKKTKDKDESAH